MALKTRIAKGDFDSLPDHLKTEYIADGDGYKLDADYEDVTGLKNKNAEILAEMKRLKDAQRQFEGIDPEAARKALEERQAAEDEKLKQLGEFERLQALREERYKADLEKATTAQAQILANLKREKLANALTERGVLPDRVKYLIGELDPQIELATTDNGFQLKKIGGIGDADEFNGLINGVKETSPFFFAADNASGSGASGSGNAGTTAGQTWTRAQWDAASNSERSAFSQNKGRVTD